MKNGNLQHLILPNWNVPKQVKAFSTTRVGGVSSTPFDSLNLALHVNDKPDDVLCNRAMLPVPETPFWLNQVHGQCVIEHPSECNFVPDADGSYSTASNRVCAIMTADCLPILISDDDGTFVAAVHAGWRGLAQNILTQAVNKFDGQPERLNIWIGPGIGADVFEVGEDVKAAFPECKSAFSIAHQSGKYFADLAAIAEYQLRKVGVQKVTVSEFCTYSQSNLFFSYRRDGTTGRMGTFIWLEPQL